MENLMARQDRRQRAGNKKKSTKTGAGETALRRSALRAVRRLLTQAGATVRSIDARLRSAVKAKRRKRKSARRSKARHGRAST
jgi:hypothetical protein